MATGLRTVLRRVAPGTYATFAHLVGKDRPLVTQEVVRRSGLVVSDGPFRGMRYIDSAAGSALLPKLAGSYECELHEPIESLIATGYDTVVDVGAAEGYYAVGLALRMPGARVAAFDIDPEAQRLCRQLASLNGVGDRVVVSGRCDHKDLESVSSGRTLVVCDCEGFEKTLLDPDKAPSLRGTDILVELHDQDDPEITPTLERRFRASHEIEFVSTRARDAGQFPLLNGMPEPHQRIAMDEYRPCAMQWAVMRAAA